ncbi:MAG: hypothetical protein DMF06_11250 [Verrucomicrobia bacterium]|nr:MAG: hypothetical protein DMF06_11250 [Verrucomicrobiota bacterium]
MPHLPTEMSEWLKGTVFGVLLLGAVGSISAYVFIEVAKYLGKRLLISIVARAKATGKWVLASNLRPFARSFALAAKYTTAEDTPRLVVWATTSAVSFWTTLALFTASLVTTVAIAIHFRLSSPVLLAFMIGVSGLIAIFLLRAFADLLALYIVMFNRDIEEINEHLKDDDTVIFSSAFMVAIDYAFAQLAKATRSNQKERSTPAATDTTVDTISGSSEGKDAKPESDA